MTETPLTGRVALVTGASRGLGRAIALTLAGAGADVAVSYRQDAEGGRKTAADIADLGRKAIAVQVDVREADQVVDFVARAGSELGTVDICVSNAGVPSPGVDVVETDPVEFRNVLDVHLMGAFHCARAVVPGMRECDRADLFFISSEVTAKTPRGRGPYTVAKAGIESLARTLALEEREHGVRVNCIAPGVINTGYALKAAQRRGFQTVEEMCEILPFGRLIDPEEIGKLCVFLATDGGYITGEVLFVNGGG